VAVLSEAVRRQGDVVACQFGGEFAAVEFIARDGTLVRHAVDGVELCAGIFVGDSGGIERGTRCRKLLLNSSRRVLLDEGRMVRVIRADRDPGATSDTLEVADPAPPGHLHTILGIRVPFPHVGPHRLFVLRDL
jgi:hypothetical protein